ncbi:MAG: hypothetical protein Q8L10_03145 [Candidatus Moranbacteria bacterium]|nr:hypothetical protein [Candidatus Moranbacteria bacterium]
MKKTNETISQLVFSPNRRSGFLSGLFLISPIKNLIRKKSAKIVSAITLFALVSGIYFASQAQGVDFTFTQTDWSGGQTVNIATHADNQAGWNEFSQKDPDITVGAEVSIDQQAVLKSFSTEVDFDGGSGSNAGIVGADDPAVIQLLGLTKQVAAGNSYTCALKTDGSVYCWGFNDYGQLGNNTIIGTSEPVQVLGVGGVGTLADITQITAGNNHTCALKNDGTAYCWGYNAYGQTGNGTTTVKYTPVQVKGVGGVGTLTDVAQIAAGNNHTCAAKTDGTAYCWGYDGYGQIGDNTITTRRTTPVQVLGVDGVGTLSDVSRIAGGAYHTCALKTDGTIFCWGGNESGQLGINSTTANVLTPIQTLGIGGAGVLSDADRIAVGFAHTCVVKTDNSVLCWGNNSNGQLGDGSDVNRLVPVQVSGIGGEGLLTDINQIIAGNYNTCALDNNGLAYCWGYNNYGQVGDGTTDDTFFPVQIVGENGVGNLTEVSRLAAGSFHTCAVKTDGSLYCWGHSGYGESGDYSSHTELLPVAVVGVGGTGVLSGMSRIVSGGNTSCASSNDGAAYCWGANLTGQLGNGTNIPSSAPVQVKGVGGVGTLSNVAQIGVGAAYACALKNDGTVYCWGYNNYGQLGNDSNISENTPVQVLGVGGVGVLSDVSNIAVSYHHTCALKNDSTVFCWGYNGYGGLGNNSNVNSSTPVQVSDIGGSGLLSGISQVSSEYYHTCALKNDNTVVCWGRNNHGQLGDNTLIDKWYPIQVLDTDGINNLSSVSQTEAGNHFTCVLKTDGTVYCWGWNADGQLGDNTLVQKSLPVQVLGVGGVGTLSNASRLSAGQYHICSVQSDSTVYCWGNNQYGSLGNNSTVDALTPVQLLNTDGSGAFSGISQTAGGNDHSCALKTDGTVYCVGNNGMGQVGNNALIYRTTPFKTNFAAGFYASGTYTSAVTDFSHTRDFSKINFNKNTPAGTTITLDARAGNVIVPDGTWTAWQTDLSDGGDIADLNGNQYLQYRVNLTTADSAVTPTLEDVSFVLPDTQSLVSSIYNTEDVSGAPTKLQWTENLSQDTDVRFQIRTSANGTDWGPWCGPDNGTAGTCNSSTYFTDPTGGEVVDDIQKDGQSDQYFQYNAVLDSMAGAFLPILSSMSVTYSRIGPATLTTSATVVNKTSSSATLSGNITNTGGENPTRYIQYGTGPSVYTSECDAGVGGVGEYSCVLTDLTPDTTYYYRAKAVNSAGEAYGTELSFITLPAEVIVNNPTSDDIDGLLADSYLTLNSGTLDATDQVTTNLAVKFATGSNQITLPDNTAITNTEGGNFDMSAFDISLRDVRSEVSDSLAAVKVGVPNTKLTFTNNPVTLSIYLGAQHNGKTMDVQYQEDGDLTWNDHTTCVITDSLCSFTTTHATTYSVNGDGSISGETTVGSSLPIEATIALACTDTLTLNPITGTGQSAIDAANEATCNIKTNNSNGYKLEWSASQENLTNATSDTISGYLPATPDTPEIWTIDQATSAWGARLKSTSTDPDTDLWGTSDGYAGKWLNVSAAAYQIIVRSTETLQTGSEQIIQFGSEIGSNKFQPTGTYTGSVVMTATTL